MSRRQNQERRKKANAAKAKAAQARLAKAEAMLKKEEKLRQMARRRPSLVQTFDAIRADGIDATSGPLRFVFERFIKPRYPGSMTKFDREVRLDKFRELLVIYERRFRRHLTAGRMNFLWELTNFDWLRPLEEWKPRGKASTTQLNSLITHLLTRYSVPHFLFVELNILMDGPQPGRGGRQRATSPLKARLDLLVHLGQGGSMRDAQILDLIPDTLTKKMLHRLSKVRGCTSLVAAIRESQVIGLGGTPRLSRAICGSFLGQQTWPREDFWMTVIHWFCNQAMLDPAQVGPLLDYIRYQRRQTVPANGQAWAIKGRTVASVMRGMEEWHGELAKVKKLKGKSYEPSGYAAGHYELKKKDSVDVWTVEEILSSKELAAEGRRMRHCVYSYGWSIDKGRVSIWSLKLNGDRLLTVEVINEAGRVVQVRGKANRMATPKENNILGRWKSENGLR